MAGIEVGSQQADHFRIANVSALNFFELFGPSNLLSFQIQITGTAVCGARSGTVRLGLGWLPLRAVSAKIQPAVRYALLPDLQGRVSSGFCSML
jgi:hypothetical protein